MIGEKKKALAIKFLAELARGYTIGYFLLFLFSSISNIGGIYYENKRIK